MKFSESCRTNTLQKRNGFTPNQKPDTFTAVQVSEDDVMGAIRSFSEGSAAGPDGLRPQHLLELIQSSENGKTLLTAITAFVNILLDSQCHMISAIYYL